MAWNEEHARANEVTYPDNPELEQALGVFRDQWRWYQQQLKFRRTKSVDAAPIQTAWDHFLKLRNQHERRTS